MNYLVYCSCGHTLELHDGKGCAGDRQAACACPLDRGAALTATVDGVRSETAAAWHRTDEASESA